MIHSLHPMLQSWIRDPTAAFDPCYPTGLYVGNRVCSSFMAKRQLIQILILGKNPPNHSLCLSPKEVAAAVLLTGWGYFLRARGHKDDLP